MNLRTLVLVSLLLLGGAIARADESAWRLRANVHVARSGPAVLLFSPDERRLVIGLRTRWLQRVDGRFKLQDAETVILDVAAARVGKRLASGGRDLVSAAFIPSGRLATVLDRPDGGQVCLEYDPSTWSVAATHTLLQQGARALGDDSGDVRERAGAYGAFSADGARFAGHYGRIEGEAVPPRRFVGRTVVWDTSTWRPEVSFPRDPGADSAAVFFGAEGQLLVDSPLEFGDREDDARHSTIERISRLVVPVYRTSAPTALVGRVDMWGPQRAAALSPDGRWLVASVLNNHAGSLLAWDIGGGRNLAPRLRALDPSPRLSKERVYSALAFSPDGHWLAAGLIDGTLRIWDTDTWEAVYDAPPAGQEITALAFSADARRLAVGSRDGRVRIWERD